MKIVRLADVTPQPWRNGGGITRDLLALPQPDPWQLRISVAEVARDGPFSPYPGVERWFSVVRGAGVVLHFGDDDRRLTGDSPPLCFDGAGPPECTLVDGATDDLNLLVRRDAGRGVMLRVEPGRPWLAGQPLRAVFTAVAATLNTGAGRVDLLPMSLAWSDDAGGQTWTLTPAVASDAAWWLAFEPARS